MVEFFQMGGYAAYVWPAYAITFVVLGTMVGLTIRAHRKTQDMLSRLDGRHKADANSR